MDFAGVDPVSDPIPVQPGQHYSMGGIDTGTDGRTGVPGLYAAGECACVSVHGANRLGGNSLLETVVFGRLTGESIARDVISLPAPDTGPAERATHETGAKISRIREKTGGISIFPLIDALKETMWTGFGIFRDEETMREGFDGIMSLKKRFQSVTLTDKSPEANPALIRYLEFEYMLPVAEAVALGARARKESRGSHTRLDFPLRDDRNFLRHTLARMTDRGISITYRPVTMGMFNPVERVY
jgi:succinate dehydrogenase / fumarate reductase, flavoprotein subunit